MREINRWYLLHYKDGVGDAPLTHLEEANRPTLGLGMAEVKGYEELMIQAWGTGADNDTFGLLFYGWQENGPGELILGSSTSGCILGAQTFTGRLINEKDESRIPSDTWFAADTYGLTAPNIIGATVAANATTAPVGGHVIIPTKGFKYLACAITGLGGAGLADEVAVLWRPTQRLRESA